MLLALLLCALHTVLFSAAGSRPPNNPSAAVVHRKLAASRRRGLGHGRLTPAMVRSSGGNSVTGGGRSSSWGWSVGAVRIKCPLLTDKLGPGGLKALGPGALQRPPRGWRLKRPVDHASNPHVAPLPSPARWPPPPRPAHLEQPTTQSRVCSRVVYSSSRDTLTLLHRLFDLPGVSVSAFASASLVSQTSHLLGAACT